MKEKSLKNIWLFSIFVLIAAFAIYLINLDKEKQNNSSSTKENYLIVKSYSDFYTVNSCVYRYLMYLQSSDADSLMKVLTENFNNKFSINKNNIFNYLKKYEVNVNYSSQKMYVEKISDDLYKYYVSGFIEKDIMDSLPEKIEEYFIVYLNKKDKLWTIEPYDGNIFR